MRIFNGKKCQIDLPLTPSQRLTIGSMSVSGDFLPNLELLNLLVVSYDYSEIALVVSGPFEIQLCSQVQACAGFIAYSLEEAIKRFSPDPVKEEPAEVIPVKEEEIVAPVPAPVEEEEAPVDPEPEVIQEEEVTTPEPLKINEESPAVKALKKKKNLKR